MNTQPSTGDQLSAYRWLIAWVVMIILLSIIAKFRVGYTVLYYLAALTLAFLLLTQYQALAWVLAPFDRLAKKSGGNNG